ncbi:MAG: hypothetical protein AABY07_03575, partial [Nanoarchaeota archaeon]
KLFRNWLKDIILDNIIFPGTKLGELTEILDRHLEIVLGSRKDINIKGESQVTFDRINTKYDAELATLETTTTVIEVKKPKNPKERSKGFLKDHQIKIP